MRKSFYIIALSSLAACSFTRGYDRGVPLRESQLEAVKAAKTKADVAAALGSPAATNLDGDKWFYFRAEGRVFAFFHPYFSKYQIVEIEFAPGDKVKEVAVRDIRNKSFRLDSRRTNYDEGDVNFLNELFGNVGSVNMAGMGGTAASE